MVDKKTLTNVYKKAKGDKSYYGLEEFIKQAQLFLKDIRKRNITMSMEVSRSGMLRKFNSLHYNALLNICYNGKVSWDKVRVGGCGMDMHWHLLFMTCEVIATKKELDKYPYNSLCSNQPLL